MVDRKFIKLDKMVIFFKISINDPSGAKLYHVFCYISILGKKVLLTLIEIILILFNVILKIILLFMKSSKIDPKELIWVI